MMNTKQILCAAVIFASLAPAVFAARTWNSAGGGFSVEGELIEVRRSQVVLRRASDGKYLLVALDELSNSDQRYVADNNPARGVVFNHELQTILDQARAFTATRNVSLAAEKLAGAGRLAKTPAEGRQIEKALALVDSVREFWEAYDAGLQVISEGGRFQLGAEQVTVMKRREDALVIETARGIAQFDPRSNVALPAELALGIAAAGAAGAADHQQHVQAFLRADALTGIDTADRDRRLWDSALAAAGSSTNANPAVAARPGIGENNPTPNTTLAPAPSADDQDKVRKIVRNLYKEEFRETRRDDQKAALASKLYLDSQQKAEGDNAVAMYVMVREASKLVAETGDVLQALSYIESLEQRFQPAAVIPLMAEALDTGARVQKDAQTHFNVIEICFDNVHKAAANDDFDSAGKFTETALAAARMLRDRRLQTSIEKHKETYDKMASEFRDSRQALQTLAAAPDDASANLAAGRYYCLVKGDWSEGLPYLIKSGDAELTPAAEKDSAGAEDAAGKSAIGDLWWELSKSGPLSRYGRQLQARAAYWYENALPGLNDVAKLTAETRINQVAEAAKKETYKAPVFKVTYLAELPVLATLDVYRSGTSGVRRDVTINGRQYPNSIWSQPAQTDGAAKVAYKLDKKYLTLTGTIGFSDSGMRSSTPANPPRSAHFRIVGSSGGKEKLLWAAPGPIIRGQALRFRANVRNVDTITLIVACDGYYIYLPAVWGSPVLTTTQSQ